MAAGDRRVTWAAFAERSRHLAWHIRHSVSPTPGDRIAIALTNRTEYLEVFSAALSLRCVPVNVSPQYPTDEIGHVLDDSDAKLVVHTPDLAKSVRTAARRIPKRWRPLLLEVGEPYEQALVDAAAAVMPADLPVVIPEANDVIFQYERGSAGTLAGAMWRSGDLSHGLAGRYSGVVLVLAPLAHSSGLFTAISILDARGTVVLIDPALTGSGRVDVSDVWRAVEQARVETIVVGSEAVRRRLVAARESDLTWDLSTLHTITAWGGDAAGGSLAVGERLAVLDDTTMRPVLPGSGEVGLVAVTGLMPVGFWKDTARTTATFRVVDGTRYAIRGDHATVDADGTVRVIGTASGTASAGVETFPVEEVERRLGKHASVQDCAVVGVPDDRSGELVVALVVVTDNHYLDEPELVAWCRTKFEHHQAPSRFLFVATLHRTESGALDRVVLRDVAAEILERERG
jgi:acyl-CoA synthetase (AMP-forming)/AMP-acid ligase II